MDYGLDASKKPIWVGSGNGSTNDIAYSYTPTVQSSWVKLGLPVLIDGTSITFWFDISNNPIWVLTGDSKAGSNTYAYSFNPTVASSWVGSLTNVSNIKFTCDNDYKPIWIGQGSTIFEFKYSRTPSVTSSWVTITNNPATPSPLYNINTNRLPRYICGSKSSANFNVNMKGSIDGQTWYYIPSPFTIATNDVYWSQSQQIWVAVGEGTNTVAYSTNGMSWTGLGTSIFSTRGNKVTFSATQNMWFIAGEGTNTLAASYDGKSWMPITSTAGYVDISGIGLYVK